MGTSEVLQLPLGEKLRIMEALWEDMRERAEKIDVSSAEKQLLDDRRSRVESGKAAILDWDAVKHTL